MFIWKASNEKTTWRQQVGSNTDGGDLSGGGEGPPSQPHQHDVVGEVGVGPGGPAGAPQEAPLTGGLAVVWPPQQLRHPHLQPVLTLYREPSSPA